MTFWNKRQSIFRLLAAGTPARGLGYRQYTTGYTTLDARFTDKVLPLSRYWKFASPQCLTDDQNTCSAYTRPKQLSEIDSECWCFRSERERNNSVPRVPSLGCVSECTTQEPFGNNELCRFHVGQWVRVGAERPISVNEKWASDTFAYRNPSQKPLGYHSVIHGLKRTGEQLILKS